MQGPQNDLEGGAGKGCTKGEKERVKQDETTPMQGLCPTASEK